MKDDKSSAEYPAELMACQFKSDREWAKACLSYAQQQAALVDELAEALNLMVKAFDGQTAKDVVWKKAGRAAARYKEARNEIR